MSEFGGWFSVYVFHVLCLTFFRWNSTFFCWISLCLRRHQTLALSESIKSHFACIRRILFLSFDRWFTLMSAATHTQTRLNGFCFIFILPFSKRSPLMSDLLLSSSSSSSSANWLHFNCVLFHCTTKGKRSDIEINIIRLLSQPTPFCFTFPCLKTQEFQKRNKQNKNGSLDHMIDWFWVSVS